ncbi:MAG: Clp protease N-terminal domain-containing protein, partial [Shewanella sp.]
MLNKDLEVTLNLAFQQAREARHEYMTVEHLLLALIDNPAAQDALIACGANLDKLRDEVASFIQQTTPIIADMDDDKETQPTLGFQRVLQRAVFHVQSSGRNEVTGANVLVAIFSEQESQAVYLLRRSDISRLDVVNYISHGFSKNEDSDAHQDQERIEDQTEANEERSMLSQFASNLN